MMALSLVEVAYPVLSIAPLVDFTIGVILVDHASKLVDVPFERSDDCVSGASCPWRNRPCWREGNARPTNQKAAFWPFRFLHCLPFSEKRELDCFRYPGFLLPNRPFSL